MRVHEATQQPGAVRRVIGSRWPGASRAAASLLRVLAGSLLTVLATAAAAGTYNPDRSIGDTVPAWEQLPGTDGGQHGWEDFAEREFVVVVFTCNSCPYAVDYEGRINELAKTYAGPQGRVGVVAINANLIPEDSPEAMRQRAESRGFVFPYLFDASQEVPKSFGALRTPEVYLLNSKRQILYMGAIDDNTDAGKVSATYLEDAIEAVLAGKEIAVSETPPVGCLIRIKRRRRS